MTSLLNLIRGKSAPGKFATATVATQEQKKVRTVASVATVAVAKAEDANVEIVGADTTAPDSMTVDEEKAIRAWLALIEVTDPISIAEVLNQCQLDLIARFYFTSRAANELPASSPFPDDRRSCNQCSNLLSRRCQAAKRGEIVASRSYEPIPHLPRRCEGYVPGADDPDRRHGRERWPGCPH